jgi:hypothetical protein
MHFWTIPFSAHDKDYEVRVVFDGMTFRLRVFLNGRPANGFEYSVTMETAMDMKNITDVDAVAELVRVAEEHVRRKL